MAKVPNAVEKLRKFTTA